MTNSFNINDMASLAQSLLDKQTKGKEFMLEDVHQLMRTAYERYPQDPVINQVAFAIEKLASKSKSGTIIDQAQISKIYNEFVRLSGETKFKDVLGFLLLEGDLSSKQKSEFVRLNRLDAEAKPFDQKDFIDQNLVNAVSAAFDGSIDSVKAFDVGAAEKGVEYVKAELQSLGFNNISIDIMGGNQHNIVYAAHFDTRKGRVTVAIPTELNNGHVLFPSTFVADDHLKELTSTNLSYFIDKKAETNNFDVPRARDVLAAIGIITGRIKTATDEFEQAKQMFGEEKNIEMSVPNLFLDRKYEEPKPDIDTKQNVEMPAALAHLARDFEDDVLEAASTFGMEAIRNGKEMVASELVSAGFKNAQVKFGSESTDSVIYLAAINTPKGPVEIEVPVEMKTAGNKYVPLVPAYFAYDGLIEDFTAIKLQRFAISVPNPSSSCKAYTSAFAYMTLPELKDEIMKAASGGDYVTCESALSEIEEKFSEEDFKNSVADYHYILMLKTRMAKQEQHTCSKMIPAGKGSIYPRCGHFGVPMHQVVADEHGNCRLKTAIEREKMNKPEDGGAAISTSKVFMS